MSIPVKTTVRCPQCGKEIEFTMWQSINDEILRFPGEHV